MILAFGINRGYAQDKNFFVIVGRLSTEDGNNNGVQIDISKNNVQQQVFIPPKSGRFRFEYEYNNEYQMTFHKDGYYKKTIIVSTYVPQQILEENSEFPPFQIEVSLVKEIPGIDKSFTNKPAGRVFYNANIDNFDSEVFFSDIQLEEQAQNARSQDQELTAEQRAALAQREKDYQQSIANADALFQQKNYEDALKKFQYAHGLFPDRPYPSDRMTDIQDLISALKLAEQRRKENDKDYQQKIAEGDASFKQQQYDQAKTSYSKALEFIPKDEYATAQLAKVDELLNQQKIDLQYNGLIADAQQKYSAGDLPGAKESYQKALAVKPDQSDFINGQIKKIDDELAAQAALAAKEKQYNDLMDQGDKAMESKNYDDALLSFQKALSVKPDDQLATSKLAEAEQIILQKKNRGNYDKYIADADNAMKNSNLDQARSLYQESLKYAPDETYPKNQIASIDQMVAQNQQFEQFVNQAKQAVAQQNFEQAKQFLTQSLEIKDDQAVKEQLQQVNEKLAQAKLDSDYADIVKQADVAMTNKQYDQAKNLYNQALGLKKEDYPANQIKQIEEEEARLAQLQKLDDQFNKTMADAEKAYRKKDYAKALDGFNAALALKPDNQLAKDRIAQTNDMIVKLDNKKKFDGLIADADGAFKKDSLSQAQQLYQQALVILPNEKYPQQQLTLIDQKMKQIAEAKRQEAARLAALEKEKQRQFDLAVQKGDSLFKLEQYDPAKQAFQSALDIKPDEAYPKSQIGAIDGALAQLVRLTTAYNKAINEANQLAKQEKYEPALAKYQEALQYLPNEEYPKNQVAKINDILAQIAAEKLRQENYQAAVQKADSLFKLKNYEPAKTSFQQAMAFNTNELYPKQKIREIDGILDQMEKARIAAEVNQKNYNEAIKRADQALADKQFDNAKAAYKDALTVLPDEQYPKDQLAKIDQLIEQEKENAYKSAIASGDQLFSAQKYSESQSAYHDALKIKPDDQYAKGQIDKITALLEQMAKDELQKQKLEKEYNEKLKNAELAFNNSQFPQAKTLYEQASTIKPKEQYPKDQMAKIDSLLLDIQKKEQINQLYTQAVRKAQSAYTGGQLEDALSYFKEAAGYKSTEPLPKKRIPEIEAEISKRDELARLAAEEKKQQEAILKVKQDNYDAALKNAKVAFDQKEYANAKKYYGDALVVFPDEQFPKDKIAQIDLLIEQQTQEEMAMRQQALQDSLNRAHQMAYDLKMKQGEQAENDEKFQDAIAQYNGAKEILPEKSGEVDARIQQVRDKIKAKQELENNYNAAIKQADGFFDQEDYDNALKTYQLALTYKPEETYPQERIRSINQINGELKKNYADAIQQADQFFKNQDWNSAKIKYTAALGLKPDEQYPSAQLAIVIKNIQDEQMAKVAAVEKEKSYQYAIAQAEKLFAANQLVDAKGQFQSAKTIKPDETYPDQRIADIDSLLAKQAADAALSKQQQEIDQKYQQLIVSADQEFKAKNYDGAKTYYQDALGVKPQETYPKDQLAMIDKLTAEAQQPVLVAQSDVQPAKVAQPEVVPVAQSEPVSQAASVPTIDNNYQSLITKADNNYNKQDYKVAQFYYQKAHQSMPDENYPKQRLDEIGGLINKTMSQADLSKYDDAIKQADQAFGDKHYNVAKFYYYQALSVKSWEQYPKDQILEIQKSTNTLLSQLKEQQYQDLISQADEAFVKKEYAVARAFYNRALSMKADEEYPKIKLAEVEKLVQQDLVDATTKTYQDIIGQGDQAMKASNYSIARFYYNKALGIKPNENYPKQQLKLIQQNLSDALKTK